MWKRARVCRTGFMTSSECSLRREGMCRFTGRKGASFGCLSASGNTLAAGASGCTYFWDRRSAQQLACFDDTHQDAVSQVRAAFALCASCHAGTWP
jgi:hypothetical protein